MIYKENYRGFECETFPFRFSKHVLGGMRRKGEKRLSCGAFPLMPYKWEDEDPVLMGNETISM